MPAISAKRESAVTTHSGNYFLHIEQALETAGLMLGSDKSRGYCLEMICADFLAGANLDAGNPDALVSSLCRVYKLLPRARQNQLLHEITGTPCQG